MGGSIWLGQIDGKKRRALFIAAIVIAASVIAVVWIVDRSERGVVLSIDTDKEEYAPGEMVQIYAQLKNYGFETVNLLYSSGLIVQFSIYNSSGSEVIVWPTTAATVITPVVLEPGGVWELEYPWHQVNGTDGQVELPDSFTVHALSQSYEHHFDASTSFSIHLN